MLLNLSNFFAFGQLGLVGKDLVQSPRLVAGGQHELSSAMWTHEVSTLLPRPAAIMRLSLVSEHRKTGSATGLLILAACYEPCAAGPFISLKTLLK